MQVTDEMVEAALRIRDTAMKQTLAARIPESGQFGAIAQDADWLVDALTAALAKAWRTISEAPHGHASCSAGAIGVTALGAWRSAAHRMAVANVETRKSMQNYTDACEAFLDCVVVLEKISGAETVDEAKRLAAEHLRATQRIRSAFVVRNHRSQS